MSILHFRIAGIKTQQFAIFPEKFVNGKEVRVESEFEFGLNDDYSRIRCLSRFNYLQNDTLLLTCEIHNVFDIREDGVALLKEQLRVPADTLRYLATIATGTARGIIHTKTEGTILNPIVLPPINLVEVISKDFVVQGNKKDAV